MSASSSPSERILLVEDDELVRRALGRTLRLLGYSVVGVGDCDDAIERFVEDPEGFDLVLMDVRMPNLDGAECIARIRGIRPIPTVMMSGFCDPSLERRLRREYVFVSKPLSADTLRRALREALEARP